MSYVCYVLRSRASPCRTYCGTTNNLTRRIRQHNGELVGGARATKTGRPWLVAAVISGFLNSSEALRYEYFTKVKHSAQTNEAARAAGRNAIQRRAALLLAAERRMSPAVICKLHYEVCDTYLKECIEEVRVNSIDGTLDFFCKSPHAASPSTTDNHNMLEMEVGQLDDQTRHHLNAQQLSEQSLTHHHL